MVYAFLIPPGNIDQWRFFVSGDEYERADRFRFKGHRTRFILSHALLRHMLQPYLNTRPEDISFSTGPFGKPEIASANPRNIRFSMSVSGHLMAVAVTRQTPVGVDVEKLRHLPDADAIARDFFRSDETEMIKTHSETKSTAFLRLWTRKEALLKAAGKGVPFLRHAPSLVETQIACFDDHDWSIIPLQLDAAYAATVAVGGVAGRVVSTPYDASRIQSPAV